MKKKILAAVLLLCTMLPVLASCGSGNGALKNYDYDFADYLSVKDGFDYTKVAVSQKKIDEDINSVLDAVSLKNATHLLAGRDTIFTAKIDSIRRVESKEGATTDTLWSTASADILSGMDIRLDYAEYATTEYTAAAVTDPVEGELTPVADNQLLATLGMKKGEVARYATRISADHEDEALRGKLAIYAVTVESIRRKDVLLSDANEAVQIGDKITYTVRVYLAGETPATVEKDKEVRVGTTELPTAVSNYLTKCKTAVEAVFEDADKLYTLFVSEAHFTKTTAQTTEIKHYYTPEKAADLTETVRDGDTVHVVYTAYLTKKEAVVTVNDAVSTVAAAGATGMESVLVGAEIGSTVPYATTLPADYTEEALRGAKILYQVKIQSVTRGGAAVASGKVEAGDTVSYTYAGYAADADPVSAITDRAEDLKVGSLQFTWKVAAFEPALVGMQFAAPKDIPLSFPADYEKTAAQGGTLNESLVIRPKNEEVTLEQFNAYYKEQDETAVPFESLDAWKEQRRKSFIQNEVFNGIRAGILVVSYPQDEVLEYANDVISEAEMYANYYQQTLSQFLKGVGKSRYGETTTELYDLAIAYGQKMVADQMIDYYIARKEGITVSKDEINAYCEEHYSDYGFETAKELLKTFGKDGIELNIVAQKIRDRLLDWAVIGQ